MKYTGGERNFPQKFQLRGFSRPRGRRTKSGNEGIREIFKTGKRF
jgi:hypothetical protein